MIGTLRLAIALLMATAWPLAPSAADFVSAPLAKETVVSPNGAYAFDITIAKRWRSDTASGTLRSVRDAHSRPVWQRGLPQPVRPRYALVADDGTVVLFDQFDNIIGPIAVMVIDATGVDVATWTLQDIGRVLGLSNAQIVRSAQHGAWIQSPPMLKGNEALVGVAGQTLAVDLAGSRLRLAKQ